MPNFRVEPYPEPLYTPANLGGLCEGCGNPMPAALAGETRHATCDLEWSALVVGHKRAVARREAARKLAQTGHDDIG